MPRRVSLADIAQDTGFSITAVSMALRNHAKIPSVTRSSIKKSARKLGYCPNPLIAALATRHFSSERTGKTPLAYFYNGGEEHASDEMMKMQQAHAQRLGYWLQPFTSKELKDGTYATRKLFSQGYQGIILEDHYQLTSIPGMDWDRFCVVGWGSPEAAAPSKRLPYRATVDHFGLVQCAWDETWKRGYRRIGFAFLPLSPSVPEDDLRWGAAQSRLRRAPKASRVTPFVFKRIDGNDTRALADWVRRWRLDAVIGFNGFILWALENEGFRIPADIGFVTLHKDLDPSSSRTERARHAGMKEMKMEVMFAALELMDQQVRSQQYGLSKEPRTIMINSQWSDGETLPIRDAKFVDGAQNDWPGA